MQPTQREYVEGCYAYYAENYYEPGNPEDGDWHDCHYPVPKCLGGEVTIKLLKQHHAVQGVLQSEEVGYPCIWGWESDYLEGELLELCKKWVSRRNSHFWENLSPSERSDFARKRQANKTPEERLRAARLGQKGRQEKTTPEQRSETAYNAKQKQLENSTQEQRSESTRKGWETRRRRAAEALCNKMLQSPGNP